MQRSTKLLFVSILFSCTVALSSCEDCQTCNQVDTGETREFCEEELDLAKESNNWDC